MEDQRCYPNYHQFDYPKMIGPQEDSQEEDSPEVEDFLEGEYQEEEEDTLEEEARRELDPWQEVDGDPHLSRYRNHKPENW